mgnify:CR=1 FL=1
MSPRARQPGSGQVERGPGPRGPGALGAATRRGAADFEKLGVFYLGRPYDLGAKQPKPGPRPLRLEGSRHPRACASG